MTRRELIIKSTAVALGSAIGPLEAVGTVLPNASNETKLEPLLLPKGPIKVGFLISEGFQTIDFAGPWEIFQDVINPKTHRPAFELYTVSQSGAPVKASGGLKVVPDHNFQTAPIPNVLAIPAQSDDSQTVLSWIRKVSAHTDLTMSVCTGAFLLAKSGLLDGLKATTHHGAYKLLSVNHPKIRVREKVRFVDNGRIATSSGLSAGIDLALHVVARYFGVEVADSTAADIEYVGYGWKNPNDTGDIFQRIEKAHKGLVCPVCMMGPIGKDILYRLDGKTYYFCSENCRRTFIKHPEQFEQHK